MLRNARMDDHFAEMVHEKDAFIATVSHEIRTPLHGISVFVSFVGSCVSFNSSPFQASADILWGQNPNSRDEHLMAIRHCVGVLNLLVENILGNGSGSQKVLFYVLLHLLTCLYFDIEGIGLY